MLVCPLKSLKSWQDLVESVGENLAYVLWVKYEGNVPKEFYKKNLVIKDDNKFKIYKKQAKSTQKLKPSPQEEKPSVKTQIDKLFTDGKFTEQLLASLQQKIENIDYNIDKISDEKLRRILLFLKNRNTIYGKIGNKVIEKINIFSVTPSKSVDKKAINKASISTQFIGFGENIPGSSTELYRKQVNEQYSKALREANLRPKNSNIPQNLQSGISQFGTLQYARKEIQDILGEKVTSIEMIEYGFRTRTTKTDDELLKYNIKVGDYVKMFGKDQYGNNKEVIVKITKITKGYDEANWYKEGWTEDGLDRLKSHLKTANAIEFQVIKPANSGFYSPNDVIFVSIPGKRGNEAIRKEQQNKTIREALKAIKAGAILITDNKAYVENSDYNEGEKRLAKNLEAKGYQYSEINVDGEILGVWSQKEFSKTTKSISADEENLIKVFEKNNIIVNPWTDLDNNEYSNKNDLSLFTNYSGGAKGADTVWEEVGKEYGLGKQVNYRPEDLKRLSQLQLEEVENAYQKAVKDLGRKQLAAKTFAGDLVRRDYLQAKTADAVFAVSTIVEPNEKDPKGYVNNTNKPIVAGGTGYAVQMAINLNKPVYVFDQLKNKWFVWKNNTFIETNTPTLTPKFAGIGTREINEKGKQAIRNVYQKTLAENTRNKYGLYKTKTKEEAIKEFISWMIGLKHNDKLQGYREFIINKIKDKKLDSNKIFYDKETKVSTYPDALNYFINKFNWNEELTYEQKKEIVKSIYKSLNLDFSEMELNENQKENIDSKIKNQKDKEIKLQNNIQKLPPLDCK